MTWRIQAIKTLLDSRHLNVSDIGYASSRITDRHEEFTALGQGNSTALVLCPRAALH